jgi:hypothetical protein
LQSCDSARFRSSTYAADHRLAASAIEGSVNEPFDQDGRRFLASAQGQQLQMNDIDPTKEIAAKGSLCDLGLQGGDRWAGDRRRFTPVINQESTDNLG